MQLFLVLDLYNPIFSNKFDKYIFFFFSQKLFETLQGSKFIKSAYNVYFGHLGIPIFFKKKNPFWSVYPAEILPFELTTVLYLVKECLRF